MLTAKKNTYECININNILYIRDFCRVLSTFKIQPLIRKKIVTQDFRLIFFTNRGQKKNV